MVHAPMFHPNNPLKRQKTISFIKKNHQNWWWWSDTLHNYITEFFKYSIKCKAFRSLPAVQRNLKPAENVNLSCETRPIKDHTQRQVLKLYLHSRSEKHDRQFRYCTKTFSENLRWVPYIIIFFHCICKKQCAKHWQEKNHWTEIQLIIVISDNNIIIITIILLS